MGIGLHLGTALLQLYGELGLQRVNRTMSRIKRAMEGASCDNSSEHKANDTLKDEFDDLETEYEVFKIRLFNEYIKYIIANSAVAGLLTLILIFISFCFSCEIKPFWAFMITWPSVLPAPLLLVIYWINASERVRPIFEKAKKLEDNAISQ